MKPISWSTILFVAWAGGSFVMVGAGLAGYLTDAQLMKGAFISIGILIVGQIFCNLCGLVKKCKSEKRIMKLEVGKTYVNRDGEKKIIAIHRPNSLYPFIDEQGTSYLETGKYQIVEYGPDSKDLVFELIEE